MQEVKGKYNTAKIFTDVVDQKSIDQVKLLCDQEFVKGSKIRMMPDIHAGAGCAIGTTMTVGDTICPLLVGVDIGCGMLCVKLNVKDMDFEKLDDVIRNCIPSGFNIKNNIHYYTNEIRINELDCYSHIDTERAYRSIGTLGGGNHFIEVDRDDEGYLYLVIHTGSRHLGVEVANYYQKWAEASIKGTKEGEYILKRNEMIDKCRAANDWSTFESDHAKLKESIVLPPKGLSYLSGSKFHEYLHDMTIVQEYANWNRLAIAEEICYYMKLISLEEFTTIHNYIDIANMILRKGAVSAREGEKLLIPINMRDGSLICVGKGNPDWNYSAPHGAGRLFGRMEAKRQFSVEEFKESMTGIYTTSVGADTLDECPMAYKSMDDIVKNIGDTVDILKVIKPVYNFKAS